MPPKPKFSREEIITAAYEIARERGIEAVVAREVAEALHTSVSPIFSMFSGMDELRQELYARAKREHSAYLRECLRFRPAFKAFGLRWIRFAEEEPHLFRLLFWSGKLQGDFPEGVTEMFADLLEPLLQEAENEFSLCEADAMWLFRHMLVQANGIASLALCSEMELSEAVVSRILSESCMSMVFYLKVKNGCLDTEQAKTMIEGIDRLPKEKR